MARLKPKSYQHNKYSQPLELALFIVYVLSRKSLKVFPTHHYLYFINYYLYEFPGHNYFLLY